MTCPCEMVHINFIVRLWIFAGQFSWMGGDGCDGWMDGWVEWVYNTGKQMTYIHIYGIKEFYTTISLKLISNDWHM